jgi:hypothetical protein
MWQTTSSMARALLIHTWLPDTFWYHAIVYATYIFNVLPVRGIKNDKDYPATPYKLFFRNKLSSAQFRVFGYLVIIRQWKIKQSSQGKHGALEVSS